MGGRNNAGYSKACVLQQDLGYLANKYIFNLFLKSASSVDSNWHWNLPPRSLAPLFSHPSDQKVLSSIWANSFCCTLSEIVSEQKLCVQVLHSHCHHGLLQIHLTQCRAMGGFGKLWNVVLHAESLSAPAPLHLCDIFSFLCACSALHFVEWRTDFEQW